MKPSSKHYRPHFVNEDTEVVYISVRSFMGSMSAPMWVERFFPGYKCSIVSEDRLATIIKESTPKDDA